ncbi:hypothetical protein EV424DRAFT_1544107 [Suillus variegatus]|nr:hypothetical protein EV424DRAFT_1544107 [Suillus variegatus]
MEEYDQISSIKEDYTLLQYTEIRGKVLHATLGNLAFLVWKMDWKDHHYVWGQTVVNPHTIELKKVYYISSQTKVLKEGSLLNHMMGCELLIFFNDDTLHYTQLLPVTALKLIFLFTVEVRDLENTANVA